MTLISSRQMKSYSQKVQLGYPFVDGDIPWTSQTIPLLACASIGAGTLAGLLGVGGGMILGPLFVALNYEVRHN
jgi:hypothetical protein